MGIIILILLTIIDVQNRPYQKLAVPIEQDNEDFTDVDMSHVLFQNKEVIRIEQPNEEVSWDELHAQYNKYCEDNYLSKAKPFKNIFMFITENYKLIKK